MTTSTTPKRLTAEDLEAIVEELDRAGLPETARSLQVHCATLEAELAEARFVRAETCLKADKFSPIDVAMALTQSVCEDSIDPLIIKLAGAYRRLYREDRSKAVIVERLVGAEQAWDLSQAELGQARAKLEAVKRERDAARAEVKRLREALVDIAMTSHNRARSITRRRAEDALKGEGGEG